MPHYIVVRFYQFYMLIGDVLFLISCENSCSFFWTGLVPHAVHSQARITMYLCRYFLPPHFISVCARPIADGWQHEQSLWTNGNVKKSISVLDSQPPTHLVCWSTPMQPCLFVTVTFFDTTLQGLGETVVVVGRDGVPVVLLGVVLVVVLWAVVVDTTVVGGVAGTK